MSNTHPYNRVPEVPYQYYQSPNARAVADSHPYSSNAAPAPRQVPGETKPDPKPPPDWPTRPKQTNHSTTRDRTSPLHDSPVDQGFTYEQPFAMTSPNSYERAYPVHTVEYGATESNGQAGTGNMRQQSMAQYSSPPGAPITASWPYQQSSSTNPSSDSGRDTNSRYGDREDDKGQAQEANASQDSIWNWSREHGRWYRWQTNAQGQKEVIWA